MTCSTLAAPALDMLWSEQPSLISLMRLPQDTWEVAMDRSIKISKELLLMEWECVRMKALRVPRILNDINDTHLPFEFGTTNDLYIHRFLATFASERRDTCIVTFGVNMQIAACTIERLLLHKGGTYGTNGTGALLPLHKLCEALEGVGGGARPILPSRGTPKSSGLHLALPGNRESVMHTDGGAGTSVSSHI
ncbi:hypothetical protein BDR07DRAFT_1378963 [Suillus spraguei]|nr:hypothetical protein BDR07DRAFT_1378963 [Suillus spraguei]